MAPCRDLNFWLAVITSLSIIVLAAVVVIIVLTDFINGQRRLDADLKEMETKAALLQDNVVHIHVWREEQALKPRGLVQYDEQQPA